MKRALIGGTLATCLALCLSAQSPSAPRVTAIYHPGDAQAERNTIAYHGGPILHSTTVVYIVYYGAWTAKSVHIVNNFVANLGGSGAYNVNSTYFDTAGDHVLNALAFNPAVDTYNDNYSFGKNLTDANVQSIVANAISAGHLPLNPNATYFVLTAPDVHETAFGVGFCTYFCGYHSPSNTIVSGKFIKYSFVGDASTQCPSGCIGNVAVFGDSTSPNGDIGADGVVSVMFHELSETVTDPLVGIHTAWQGAAGENGDLCNFKFGTTFLAPNGSHANQTLGGREYLIQTMFKLTGSTPPVVPGVCVNSLP